MIVIAVIFQCTFNTIIQAQSYIGQMKSTIIFLLKMLTNMEDHYISSEQTLYPEINIKYYGVGFMNQYKRLHLQHHHHHLSFMMLKQNE